MRAMRLASATATSIRGLRASIRASQGSFVVPRRTAQFTLVIAPTTNSRLRSRWPILDILPSLGFPPVACCRGTRPSQAETSRPRPEALHRRREGLDRHRGERTDARDTHQPYRLFVLARPLTQFLLQSRDLLVERGDLTEQQRPSSRTGAGSPDSASSIAPASLPT